MSWDTPFAFVLVPPAFWAVWWIFRVAPGSGRIRTFAQIKRLWASRDGLSDRPAATRRRARGILLAVAIIGALVALARPQWGAIHEQTYDQAREVLLAVDLSRSMLADDVSPTRLERAKLLINALLDQLRGERVGLVVFAGTSFVQSPLSADYEVLREFVADLQPSYLPQGGTDYDAMLRTAVKAYGQTGDGDRFLVVLSDGEAHDEEWKAMIPALRERGVRVIGLGIGTAAGALVPDGAGGLIKDEQGAAVLSRLEPATLQELAAQTGGTYRDAATWVDIADLVNATVEQGRKGRYVEQQLERLQDRYQWFLAPAVLLFFLSYWLEFPLFPLTRIQQRRMPRQRTAPISLAAMTLLAIASMSAVANGATTPPTTEPNKIEALVSELAAKPQLGAADYARLAESTIEFASQPAPLSEPARVAVIDDALRGVDAGEALDRTATDWAKLRQALEQLKQPKEQPPQQQQADQQSQPEQQQQGGGDSQQQQSGGAGQEQNEQKNQDSQQSASTAGGGQGQEQSPRDQQNQQGAGGQQDAPEQRDAKDQQSGQNQQDAQKQDAAQGQAGAQQEQQHAQANGENPSAEPKPLQGNDVGIGQLDSEQPEPSGNPADQPPPGTRLVGGGTPQSAPADEQDPALLAAMGKMDRIKDGDAPAVLFDRMNRADGTDVHAKNGKNW